MRIISWDVGVIHLAYCILEYIFDPETKKTVTNIIDWDEINLIEDDRIKLSCCGKTKTKKNVESKVCGKNSTYYLATDNNVNIGFCKLHLSQHAAYWSIKDTMKLFTQINSDHEHVCNFVQKTNYECGRKAKYVYKYDGSKLYYCTTHYKSELKKKIKEFSPKTIKNLMVKKYPTSQLQLNLVKKLDELIVHFAKLGVEEVIIENQPSQKNPKMKSIANTLFDYFMIRGYVDKIHRINIKLVRFMCPSNKLKINADNTLSVFKNNKNSADSKTKYKLTKELGIRYTKQLLNENLDQLEYLDLYKKQDDMADAYLQGRYYLEYLRLDDDGKAGEKNMIAKNMIAKNMINPGNKKQIKKSASKKVDVSEEMTITLLNSSKSSKSKKSSKSTKSTKSAKSRKSRKSTNGSKNAKVNTTKKKSSRASAFKELKASNIIVL
jgi:hypothetical protein